MSSPLMGELSPQNDWLRFHVSTWIEECKALHLRCMRASMSRLPTQDLPISSLSDGHPSAGHNGVSGVLHINA